MSDPAPIIHRWTYNLSADQVDVGVRQQVFSHLLDVVDRANEALENDIRARVQSLPTHPKDEPTGDDLQKVLKDLLPNTQSLAQLRAVLGGVRNSVKHVLMSHEGQWEVDWSDAVVKTVPTDVLFMMDVIAQSVVRMYGNDLRSFQEGWRALFQRHSRHVEKTTQRKEDLQNNIPDNPLDVVAFLRVLHHQQNKHHLTPALQKLMFVHIEQDLVQAMGFLLFDVNNRLDELGVTQGESHLSGALDKEHFAHTATGEAHTKANDDALLNTLCDLLRTWEPSVPDNTQQTSQRHPLNHHEVFASLSQLQQWVPKVLEDALGNPDGRVGRHIKASIIQQAEAMGIPAGQAHMQDDDNRAVDLVDEVFAQNLYARKMQDASRSVMAQILFPSVKAAILNRQWFAEAQHPARRFIASMSDACAPLAGEAQENVVRKASQTVDRLVAGFNEDVSIFEALTEEIQEYIAHHTNSAPQNTNQSVDALGAHTHLSEVVCAVGIREELQRAWAQWHGPQLLRDFALDLGTACLARLEHRQLRNSLQWHRAMNALGQLLLLRSSVHAKVAIDGVLRQHLIEMLADCQWTGVRAHEVLAAQEDIVHAYHALGQRQFAPYALNLCRNLSSSDETSAVAEADIDGCSDVDTKSFSPPLSQNIPQNNETVGKGGSGHDSVHEYVEDVVLNKIVHLVIGSSSTWINGHNETVVVKLSWISPISSKYLFVNKNGARVLVGTPKELAAMAHKGRFFPGVVP